MKHLLGLLQYNSSDVSMCFAIFPMDKNIEQRICLKFCIINGISCAESLKMSQKAYGESTLSKRHAFEWYSAFKIGRNLSLRDIAAELSVSHESIRTISNDCLGMKRLLLN